MKTKLMMMAAVVAVALGAWADTETVDGYTWTYRINGDTAEIFNSTRSAAISPGPTGAVSIPSTLGDKPVTSIGEWSFYNCSGLTSVTIPDLMTSIGASAFYGCSSLTSVTIPDSVTSIGSSAFSGCNSLKSVTIPQYVCTNRFSSFFVSSLITNVIIGSDVTSIGNNAFSGCSGLKNVTIPASVTNIATTAFSSCSGLKSFVVADGNPSYRSDTGLLLAKDGTTLVAVPCGLANVTIPDGVTDIGNNVFSGYSGLISVEIPASVTNIATTAFSNCNGLESVVVADDNPFYCSDAGLLLTKDGTTLVAVPRGLTSVTIPDSVASIGDKAFYGCSGLTSVTIPDSVTSIGSSAFYNCSGLTSVTIADGVTDIGSYAFRGCSGLTSVAIPASVANIGSSAFYGCRGLTSVTIPDSVTSIGSSAFYGCSGLESITIPDGVTSVGALAFGGCNSLTSITIPASLGRVTSDVLPSLSKQGSSFNGWWTALEGGEQVLSGRSLDENLTIYPRWEESVVLTFDANGGRVSPTQREYKRGTSVLFSILPTPTRSGMFFRGWYADAAGECPIVLHYQGVEGVDYNTWRTNRLLVTASMTLYAQWGNYVNVTFDANGGTVDVVQREVKEGFSLGTLPVPTRDGQVFCGWRTERGGGVLVTEESAVTVTMTTLYAQWDDGQPVTFDVGGGVLQDDWNRYIMKGQPVGTLPIPEARDGMTFLGWRTAQDGGEWVTDETVVSNAVTFYAQWDTTHVWTCENGTLQGVVPAQGDIIVPEFVNCMRVTAIGNMAFSMATNLTSVTAPEGVTNIGYRAFYSCSGLTSVRIPDSVTDIGSFAFYNCGGLTSITIPDSVTFIGSSAFCGCNGLADADGFVVIRGVLYGYAGTEGHLTVPGDVTSVASDAFIGCTNLTRVTVAPNVGSFQTRALPIALVREGFAFNGWWTAEDGGVQVRASDRSRTVFISETMTFYAQWTPLVTVTFDAGDGIVSEQTRHVGQGLTVGTLPTPTREGYLFLDWWTTQDGGERVTYRTVVPDAVTFYAHWTPLVTVTLDMNDGTGEVQTIRRGLGTLLGTYGSFPSPHRDGMTFLGWRTAPNGGDWFISHETVLTSDVTLYAQWDEDHVWSRSGEIIIGVTPATGNVAIPECINSLRVSVIGPQAFQNCTGLTGVTIPSTVTNIGDRAFQYCSGLTSVTIADGVTSIGNYAFYGCSGLTGVTVPNSVANVGAYAFEGCSGLTDVTIGNGVTNIGIRAFNCSGLTNVMIPQYVCTNRLSFIFSSSYQSITNVTIGSGVTDIGSSAFRGCSGLTGITIPDSVTNIGSYAFYGCSGLTSMTIPARMTSIGNGAFNGCSCLKSVMIRDGVTTIGREAFSGCSGLTSVTIPASVTSIGYRAFYNCGLTSVTIPDSVTSIGGYAFYGCSGLTSMTIPDGVTSIGYGAVYNCTRLRHVTIPQSAVNSFRSVFGEYSNLEVSIADGVTSIGERAFYGCSGLKSVTIPDSVTDIGNYAFYGCSGLTGALTIPDGVTSIGDYAFSDCSGLKSVTIPDSVTSIGERAFYGCSGLTSVTIPQCVCTNRLWSVFASNYKSITNVTIDADVTSIGEHAFSGCSGLRNLTIPDSVTSIGGYAFSGCSGLTSMMIGNGVTSIGEHAFSGCSGLRNLTIPDSVTNIGGYAFSGCSGLTSVTIGNGVTSIGASAFSDCSGLKSVTIPDSVTSIGDYAFGSCTNLTSVTIGNGVTSIGTSAFRGCHGLTSVTIGNGVTSIGASAFEMCNNLTSVTISDSVTSIGVDAFRDCSNLTSVTIPDSVTSIGRGAFSGCRSLTSVTIPSGVTSIGNGAFYNCSGLTRVTIPSSVTSIGDEAFSGCRGLTSVMIPSSVRSIGQRAFYSCSGLTSVMIPDSVTSIGSDAFYNCSGLTSVTIPSSVTSIGNRAFGDCRVLERVVIFWRESFRFDDIFKDSGFIKNLALRYGVTNIASRAFAGVSHLTSVSIPSSVTSIGDEAFSGCRGLTSVMIPSSVTRIGNGAFSGCSGLRNVTIPSSVTSIGNGVFSGCSGLTNVTIPSGVTSIGASAFYGCSGLTSVTVSGVASIGSCAFSNCSSLTSVTVSGATSIGSYAFSNCSSLTSVTVSSGVKSVWDYAFSDCTSLTSMTIPASVTSWGNGVFSRCVNLIVRIPWHLADQIRDRSLAVYFPGHDVPIFEGGENCSIDWYEASQSPTDPIGGGSSDSGNGSGPTPDVSDKTGIGVSHVRAHQRLKSGIVDIYYDLAKPTDKSCRVAISVKSAGEDVPSSSIRGDCSLVYAGGKDKHIVWDVGSDWPGHQGTCVVTVYADNDSASTTVDVDLEGDFRIDDVFSLYCEGEYGGIGGRKATFLEGVSCEVDFSVWSSEFAYYDIDHLLVNGQWFPVENKYGDFVEFTYDVGMFLSAGRHLDVVAVRKNGHESAPFRVNLEMAKLPRDWSRSPEIKSSILMERVYDKGCIEYYTIGLNSLWLFESVANELKIEGLKELVKLIPEIHLWQTYATDTAQYRVCAQTGVRAPILRSKIKAAKKQILGEFSKFPIGVSFIVGGQAGDTRTYEWSPKLQIWRVLPSKTRLGIELDASLQVPVAIPDPLCPALPLIGRTKIGVRAAHGSELTIDYDPEGNHHWVEDINFDPFLELYGMSQSIELGARTIQWLNAIDASLVLKCSHPVGSLSEAIHALPKIVTKWGVRGKSVVRVSILGHEIMNKTESLDHWWIDRENATQGNLQLLAAVPAKSDYKLIPRDYLGHAGARPSLMAASTGNGVSLGDGYPNPVPTLAVDGQDGYLVYLRDNTGRSAINRTELVYHSGVSNEWNGAAAVWNDGTADFMPSMAASTNGVVFTAWANVKTVLSDEATFGTMCSNLEIAVGMRDPATGAWRGTNLTDDAVLDRSPIVKVGADGSAAVVWARNEHGAFFGSMEMPSALMFAVFREGTWSTPLKVADVGNVMSYDLAYDGTVAEVVWSKADNDGKRTVWGAAVVDGVMDAAACLSSEGKDATQPFAWFDVDGTLHRIWLEDNALTADGDTIAGADALNVAESFAVAPMNGGKRATLVWWSPAMDGKVGGELMSATYDAAAGFVGEALPLDTGDNSHQVRNISGAFGDDGALCLAYESVAMTTNAEGTVEYGAVELKTFRQAAAASVEFAADAFAFADDADVSSGEFADINVKIANAGTETSDDLEMWLWFSEGADKELLHVVTTNVPPLSTITLPLPWYAEEGLTNVSFTAELREVGNTNAVRSMVWRPDLGEPRMSFHDVQCINATDTLRLIRATLHNDSMAPLAAGTEVRFWRGEIGGELLGTDTNGVVTAGDNGEYSVGFSWDMEEIAPTAAVERVVIELMAGESHPVVSVEVAAELAHVEEHAVISVDTQFDAGLPAVSVRPGVKLTVSPASGETLDASALTNKLTIVPLDAAQHPRFFKVVSKETGGSVILEVVINADEIGIEETVRELVASKALERLARVNDGASVELTLLTAKEGFHYGVAASAALDGLTDVSATAPLVRAGADGVTLTVTKPHGASAFFKVVVSDRAQ